MALRRLISFHSSLAIFGRSFGTASTLSTISSRIVDAPFSVVATGATTFSMAMTTLATVLGYGNFRRIKQVRKEREEADREKYLLLSGNPTYDSAIEYHELLKRYLEEGRAAELFQVWKEEHKKVYKDAEEENRRFQLFKSDLKWMVERNPHANYGLMLDHTCDLTPEEYKEEYPDGSIPEDFDLGVLSAWERTGERENLPSCSLMMKHRLMSPVFPWATATKSTFFSTPRPNTAMPYPLIQSYPRPNSFLPRGGNNNGISSTQVDPAIRFYSVVHSYDAKDDEQGFSWCSWSFYSQGMAGSRK